MKVIYQILLVLLFLLISTVDYSSLTLIVLVLLIGSVWIIDKKGKLRIPQYLYLAFFIYFFFLIIGFFYTHKNPTIDIKFQIYGFLFYLFLLNVKNFNFLRFLFILNFAVFAVYVLLYLGLLPNLWSFTVIGYRGRVYGPAIIPIVLISFYYLVNRKPLDLALGLSFLFAMPYLVLTTNLMNMVIAAVLLFLIIANFRKIFKPGYIVISILIIASSIAFFNSDFAPPLIKEKLPYVLKPTKYASLRIRIEDFGKAVRSEDFGVVQKIFGKGFGASTTIYRENEEVQAFSQFFTFQEIDNGFYYIYHRGGFLLLFIFFILHLYLYLKLPTLRAKLGFVFLVLFTNLLSIHYFNNVFYLLIPFLILESTNSTKLRFTKNLPNEE
ncbi:hypothetical protein [Aequorivita marina]|uniref:hypothetical protein n=1 Tax=Aequorivita marina TaxID=3073654 RepID=UPI002876EC20|nr:hypothetical protein [Aequorivita sp. S2608]MDS1298977.1 hypothetical protein [Aequorivita sp. S2608]